MSRFTPNQIGGFGWNQYINFGKHKGKTFYDLSNTGDFDYLKWCLKCDIGHVKGPNSFYIADSCMPHIRAALSVEGIKTSNWIKDMTEPDETGKIMLRYICQDQQQNMTYTGPNIEMKMCPQCNQIKTISLFNVGDGECCSKCFTQQDLKRTSYQKVVHEIENQRGTKESYNQRPKPIYATGKFQKSNVTPIKEHTGQI